MILPLSWLREFVDVDVSAEELEKKLFSCGFEVEKRTCLGENVTGVVVGRVETCKKHPDADRLFVCQVDLGTYGKKQICTAATNVFEGAKVPCALDGATVLKEGGIQKIKTGKLRGELSEGMFCSGEELGIGDDFYEGAEVNGILILDEDTPVGEDVKKFVGLDDVLFDIAVTANRPDCQSILGLAREVSAVLKKPLKMPETRYTPQKTAEKITVEVQEPGLCPRYMGHFVTDVKIIKSPRMLRRRLALCGLRSVNSIVDVTNYVLLEIGQPMHAFDKNFLRGGGIVVRRAEEGEQITTLDKKTFSLKRDNLLICDKEGPIGIAGVMGGLNSEIKDSTREVFFESASFARESVRRTSRSLGQRSDSSARYEKGVNATSPELGLDRALHLVEQYGFGTVTTLRRDVLAKQISPKKLTCSAKMINSLLGIKVPEGEIKEILTRLGFTVREQGKEFEAEVPLWRDDVEDWPDLAEEIIRMYGYEHLKPTLLESAKVTHGGRTEWQKQEMRLKSALVREGFFEACNYSFFSPKSFDLLKIPEDAPERKAIQILNPIGEDLSVMRTFLGATMLSNVVRNVRRGNAEGKLFEIAKVYVPKELPITELPEEKFVLCMALWGKEGFFDLKGAAEDVFGAFGVKFSFERGERSYLHPGVTAYIKLGERKVGYLGELHPSIAAELSLEEKVYLLEIDLETVKKKFAKDISFHPLPRFESVKRDIAFVVKEEVTCADAENCIKRACRAVGSAELFDVYRDKRLGEGKKSMAFTLTFLPAENADKPLSPEQVDTFFEKIVSALKKEFGAELRE